MIWWRQVLHVFARDVCRTTPLLVAFLFALTLAILRAVEWQPLAMTSGMGLIGTLLLPICAATLVGTAVIGDSAIRADAFWAIQPLHASAVAAGKLLYAFGLIACGEAGSFIVLHSWGLEPMRFLLSDPWPVAAVALSLLGIALVGTVSTDVKSLVLSLIAITGATLVIGLMLGKTPLPLAGVGLSLLTATAAASAVGMLLYRYRSRSPSWPARVATAGCGLFVMSAPGLAAKEDIAKSSSDLGRVTLAIPLTAQPTCGHGSLIIPVRTSEPTGWHVSLMTPTLTVSLLDGTAVTVAAPQWYQRAGTQGPLLPATAERASWRVLGGDGHMPDQVVHIEFELSPTVEARVCGRIRHVSMLLHVASYAGQEVLRVPLGTGSGATTNGARARVLSTDLQDARVALRIRVSRLASRVAHSHNDAGTLGYGLLNVSRREVVRLHDTRDDDFLSVSELPGVHHMAMTSDLELYPTDSTPVRGLQQWRDSSVLLITLSVEQASAWTRIDADIPR